MRKQSTSFIERVIRAVTRGAVPIDASQCDGPCVVHAPADAIKAQGDGGGERRNQIRWLSLR
jgi:hypothetical protein